MTAPIAYLPHTRIHETVPDGCVTAVDLQTRAGISYRQLDYWTRTGLLTDIPRPRNAGSGIPRYYPTAQIPRATALRMLLDAGVSLVTGRQVIDELLERGQVRVGQITIHLPVEL